MERKGEWFQTWSGVQFYPYDPRPEDVVLTDIVEHLSKLCRFNGACRNFYSVAQHSAHVSDVVRLLGGDVMAQRWGLLHDAAEAYIGDMVRPLKRGMPAYVEVEEGIERAIALRFELPWPMPPVVKRADNILLAMERRDLLRIQRQWSSGEEPMAWPIDPMVPRRAREFFVEKAKALEVYG